MFLRIRPALYADLEQCLPFTRDAFAFGPELRPHLLRMWQALYKERSGQFFVVEDRDQPAGANVAYFYLVVCVTQEFAAQMKTTLPPFIGLQVLERWRAGTSPILPTAAVRRDNARGELVMVCLQSGIAPQHHYTIEGREVRDKVVEWMGYGCDGYRIREGFIEAYTPFSRAWQQAAGFHVCHEYDDYYAACAAPPPPEQRACLMHLSREVALGREGSVVSKLFTGRTPRFSFTPGEQEVLLWALAGDTDDEIAGILSVAEVTVKKRWESIYRRILDAAPEFFGPGSIGEGRRGTEKRRRVLEYVRSHMEETRPFAHNGVK